MARALCDPAPLVVIDEFTSVVDRTVAQIGSAAVAKAVRRTSGKQVVAVTCHYDVEEWLCPDWVVEMPNGNFARRSLRRPPIELEVARVHSCRIQFLCSTEQAPRDVTTLATGRGSTAGYFFPALRSTSDACKISPVLSSCTRATTLRFFKSSGSLSVENGRRDPMPSRSGVGRFL